MERNYKMYKCDIVISTRGRLEKLKKVLDSIPGNTAGVELQIRLAFDGDEVNFKKVAFGRKLHPLLGRISYIDGPRGNVYCRNELIKACEDAVLYSTDDIIFQPGAISKAVWDMRDHFPDDDGVIGFTQTGNKKFHPTGVALVGRKFLARYPHKQLFYPKYFHFACQEIHDAAVKLNKFFLSKAEVFHMNPFIEKKYMDKTHHEARILKDEDHKLMAERKKKGLIWGINE